ncbi:MAG: protein phosphatase 2C domain-containing protein [Tetrasphaera sp.]
MSSLRPDSADPRPAVTLAAGVCTDRGTRPQNEDAYLAEAPLFLVADGMGGHEDGRTASACVVEAFRHLVGRPWISVDDVRAAIDAADDAVHGLAGDGRAPGSTLAGVGVTEQDGFACWLVFNIGDSRVYRLGQDGDFEQLSIDHSHVQELVEAGELSPRSAKEHERRNVITRALGGGMPSRPDPDQWLLRIEEGDRMLVCSDGLTGEVTDQLIAATLLSVSNAQQATADLVAAAISAGGRDNVTVVVVDAVAVAGAPLATDPTREIDLDQLPPVDLDARTRPARRGQGGNT